MAKKELPMEFNENTNSYQLAEEKKEDQKKTKASISLQKESTWKRVKRAFIAEEVTSLKDFTIFDVVIPAIKRTFRDLIVNSIDITLGYGKSSSKSPYRMAQNGSQTYVAYGSSGRYANDDGPREKEKKGSPIIGPMELERVKFTILDDFGNVDMRLSHEAALEALGYLMDMFEDGYDVVTVAQFLSYVSGGSSGIHVSSIHSKWGWYSLQGSAVVECADGSGCYIRFPKPVPI